MPFTSSGSPVLAPFALAPDQCRPFLEAMAKPPYITDERYLLLGRRQAHLEGTQYAHQAIDWWGNQADAYETISPKVGLPEGFTREAPEIGLTTRDKRPSIESGTAATIVDGFTELMLSEQSCPRLTVEQDPDTEAMLLAFAEDMGWWQKWAYARNMGGGVGSVCATWHARDGKIDMEVHNTKQVIPLWRNRRAWLPAAILKFWIVTKEEDVLDKKGTVVGKKKVDYCYRRIISEIEDVVYKPIRLDEPETWTWVPEEALSVRHDLGMFPGVWVQNTPNDEDKDGDPDCQGAWKQIDAYDRLMSQMNKGTLAFVDPTLMISDDPKEAPGGQGGSVKVGSDNTLELTEKGKAALLEMEGTGFEAASKFCDRLERIISQRTGFVFVDPKDVGGAATSSLTVKMMFRPMIQRADKKRGQYGPAIIRGYKVVEAIARKFDGQTVPLPPAADGTQRIGVFKFDLPRKIADVPQVDGSTKKTLVDQQLGPGGNITIKWGPYFNKTPDEEGADIANAVAAKTGGLVDADTAIRHVASEVFGVRDVESMSARITEEQAEETDRLLQQQAASFPLVGGSVVDAGAAPGGQGGALANRQKPGEKSQVGGEVQ